MVFCSKYYVEKEIEMGDVKFIPIHNWDNIIASTIKAKLNSVGGETEIKNGNTKLVVGYAADESGISFKTAKGEETVLVWDVFFATVDILRQKEGKALKGDANKGKLGTKALPLDSVEGYVAENVFGKKKRQTVEKNITKISTLLKWADIITIGKDYLQLNEDFK